MANKKTTKKAPAGAKKRRAPAPPPRMSKKEREEIEAQQIELEEQKRANSVRITSIVIFAVSFLFFCIAVVRGDGVWNIVHNFYIGMFGWFAAIALSLLCLVYSFIFTVKNSDRKMTFEGIAIAVLVLLLSAFVHIIAGDNQTEFLSTAKDSYLAAPDTFNGGLLGSAIGWLLLTMGKAPAIIIDLLLVVVDIMLLSKVTVNQFFKNTAKPVKKVVEKAAPYFEERRERKKNIDVFLDD